MNRSTATRRKVIWAEYTPEKVDGKKTAVYLMKIRVREAEGINYTYSRISSAEILRYDAKTYEFSPVWTEEEREQMEYAPVISFIPVIIASCALNAELEKRVVNLGHSAGKQIRGKSESLLALSPLLLHPLGILQPYERCDRSG